MINDQPQISDLKKLYGQLLQIRLFEEQVARLVTSGEVPGLTHISIGQEAVAAGVCAMLKDQDYIFSGHRAHGHILAKGSEPKAVLSEILGRADGLCQGRGGSMHLLDLSRGMLGATGVVGGNLPLALGAAWAAREQGEQRIVAVFFGDGASGNGIFHESLNIASLWQLPVLFVCENNGYAEFTSREEHSNVDLISKFAEPYKMSARVVDGNDVLAVMSVARELTKEMKANPGPRLLECMTYRLSGHYVGDPQQYRSKEELAEWRAKDPIARLKHHLLVLGVLEEDLVSMETLVQSDTEEIVRHSLAASRPDPADVLSNVYASIGILEEV